MSLRFARVTGLALAICWGCGVAGPDALVLERIEKAEAELRPFLKSTDAEVLPPEGERVVSSLLRDYAAYANAHHGDSLAVLFLMRRADLLQGRGDHEAAVNQWLDVAEGGGPDECIAESIFRVGFLRETELKDTTGALKAYAEVMRIHPNSQWASSAGDAAKWLTFSESEFIKALQRGQD